MYDTVCIDLDGTLLDDNKKITKKNIKILKRLSDNNIQIIIATGRPLLKAISLTRYLKFDFTIIANNGAIISDNNQKKIYDFNPIDRNLFNNIYKIGESINLYPNLHIYHDNFNKNLVVPRHKDKEKNINSVSNIRNIITYNEYDIFNSNNILTMVYINKEEKIHKLKALIENKNIICQSNELNINKKGMKMFECLNPKANKLIGIKKYLNLLNKDISTAIAIGDENNDIEMIKEAGLGISMKNGITNLKRHSDLIATYDNNNNGVGIALENIFFK